VTVLDFSGQVVLVTGAGSGIGAAVAEGFGRQGAHVVVHYGHNREGAEKVAGTIGEAGGEDRGHVEVHDAGEPLVNNAGDLLGREPVTEMTDERFTRVMDLNMTSVFAACRQAVPVMQRQGAGAIVNLTSVAARTGGAGGSVAYATAKGAVSTFTRGLAKEVARTGIRVNAIAPGIIVTPFHERHTSDEQMAAMVSGIPMGRPGTPDECVGTVLFLADPAMSGYVTGQVIEINGGQLTP
jgi:3-oxoacyl-[acyl-carrier protein] reductase